MPDVSTMDSSAVLQRVEEIQGNMNYAQSKKVGMSFAHYERTILELCSHLRTALADTRRVDWIEQSERLACCWNVDGHPRPNNGWTMSENTEDSMDDTFKGATWRELIDTAMAATPRES